MLKRTITFEDLDGNELTEDFWFGLSKAELAELELSKHGGLNEYLRTIVEAQDGDAVMRTFREIIAKSVGRRSEDNRRFIKNEDIVNDFMQTDAYSVLFVELVTDAQKAAEFVNGVVPRDLASDKSIEEIEAAWSGKDAPAYIRENRAPTPKELAAMNQDELQRAFQHKLAMGKNEDSE